jgi:hypothetical protein
MPRKTVTRQIGNLEVTTTQFGSTTASTLIVRLLKVVGPAIEQLAPMLGTADLAGIGKMNVAVIGPALVAVAEAVGDSATFEKLLTDILRGTLVIARDESGKLTKHDLSGGREAIDGAFDGRLRDLFVVVAFALEVNFGDFFAGLAPAADAAPAA